MTVERTRRDVIERKLLTALEDGQTVAILASKQDLEDFICALEGWNKAERIGDVLTWQAQIDRFKSLSEGLNQLLKEAFPQ